MKNLFFAIGLMASMSLAFANPNFNCHGTYENEDGVLIVIPDISATGSGEVSMEYKNNMALCLSTAVDARTIRMMCGASSLVGSISNDCKTLTANNRPYYLKRLAAAGTDAAPLDIGSSTPALHVIGVHEGQPPLEARERFAAKCGGRQKTSPASSISPPSPPVSGLMSRECSNLHADMQAQRQVTVSVTDATRPIVLALSAYNSTVWKISLKKDVSISKVILSGYHSQKISGIPTETPVEVYTYESSPCKQCWQSPNHFYSYEKPAVELKEITGLEATSFQGRYSGSEFSIFPGMKKFEIKVE